MSRIPAGGFTVQDDTLTLRTQHRELKVRLQPDQMRWLASCLRQEAKRQDSQKDGGTPG